MIKIGVIGGSSFAKENMIPTILELDNYFTLSGIASRSNEKALSLAKQFNTKGFDRYEDLLNEELDAIYLPLPNSLHFEWVKKALEKGLHVLVEKSIGCTYDEVVELNRLAEERKLALIENFQFRFHSQLAYVMGIIKRDLLGELRIVRSTFCFPPFPDKENIRYQKKLGGGVLLDAGAYPLKLSQLILGNDLEVTSSVLNFDKSKGVDIWGGAFLKQKNGNLFSQIAFGFDNYYQCNLEIIGSEGKLYTNRIFTAKKNFEAKIILETNKHGIEEIELETDEHFKNMLIYFYKCIRGMKNLNVEYVGNINQARLIEQVKQLAKNKES